MSYWCLLPVSPRQWLDTSRLLLLAFLISWWRVFGCVGCAGGPRPPMEFWVQLSAYAWIYYHVCYVPIGSLSDSAPGSPFWHKLGRLGTLQSKVRLTLTCSTSTKDSRCFAGRECSQWWLRGRSGRGQWLLRLGRRGGPPPSPATFPPSHIVDLKAKTNDCH